MSQQINLFNTGLQKQKNYFSAAAMAQALGLIILGLILLGVYTRYQVSNLSKQMAETTTQLVLAQNQQIKINADYGPRPKNKVLEDAVQKKEKDLKLQQQILDIVQHGTLGNTSGYSEYLRAFSRQIINGLWLTGFSIVGAGNQISLQGRTVQADLVPAYISRLKQEPVMQGKSFDTLQMQTPQQEPRGKDRAELENKTANANSLLDAKDKSAAAASARPMVTESVAAPYIEFTLQSSGIGRESPDASGATSK